MGLENLKRWHWVLVGAAVGAGLGFVWSGAEPGADLMTRSPVEIERDLGSVNNDKQPIIRNVTIYPLADANDGRIVDEKTRTLANTVTYEVLTPQRDPKAPLIYKKWRCYPDFPYRPAVAAPTPIPANYSFQQHLDNLKKTRPTIGYRYAWWHEPRWLWTLAIAGGVIVIGGIWPFIISLIIGAGLAPAPKKKEEYDLDRFGKGEEPVVAKAIIPADADAKLRELEASLEESLKGYKGPTAVDDNDDSGAPIRKLDASPLPEEKPAAKPAAASGEPKYVYKKDDFFPTIKAKKSD